MRVEIVDVEGAVRAYLTTYPGLVGAGNPVPNGFHLGERRSPAAGVTGDLRVVGPRDLTDISDDARVSIRLRAVGSESGARGSAERAARATARAMMALSGQSVDVVTGRGEPVRLLVAGEPAGPTEGGNVGGQSIYLFDCSVRCQSLGQTYGLGAYGNDTYGA